MRERLNRDLIVDADGTVERVPYPLVNPLPTYGQIKRPTLTSYEDGLEWNKQAQAHTEGALSFTQEYAAVKVSPQYGHRYYVHNFSDLHFGHNDTDYDLLNRDLMLVYDTPDVGCIFGWNILDATLGK